MAAFIQTASQFPTPEIAKSTGLLGRFNREAAFSKTKDVSEPGSISARKKYSRPFEKAIRKFAVASKTSSDLNVLNAFHAFAYSGDMRFLCQMREVCVTTCVGLLRAGELCTRFVNLIYI